MYIIRLFVLYWQLIVRKEANFTSTLTFDANFDTHSPVVFSLQVAILLYVADLIVRLMWRRSLDPDNFSIPYLTALGDLLGTGFLALCFHCVSVVQSLGL